MSEKKILFVDDDPNILSGLRRMLRSMRDTFELHFAENGASALDIMSDTEFDVVVSDMRMPGMDGAELLTQIQERYPYSIRIMLTGHANEDSILRTVGVVHQFLSKPCESEHLKAVLLRASALHDLISHVSLKKLVSGLDSLPSLPEVYARLRKAMANPDVSIADVAGIIEEDMAMSAKVLQLVNSAFFGLFRKIDSPAHAVNLLGLNTVKNLVLGVGAFTEIKASSKQFSVRSLWSHSMLVGGCAKKIAMNESNDKELIDNCFISGILHDVGKLVLLAKMTDEYERAVTLARETNISLRAAEKQIFDTTHSDIGSYLMGLWGLQGPVVEGIGFHHRLDNYPDEGFSPALAVHAANVFCHESQTNEAVGARCEIDLKQLEERGMGDKIDTWREICVEYINQGGQDG